MKKLRFAQCERVLLDTTVFINALSKNPGNAYNNFVRDIIFELTTKKSSRGRSRRFLVSDITISELISLSSVEQFGRDIAPILDSSDVDIYPFDTDCAIWVNNNFRNLLVTQAANDFLKKTSAHTINLKMGREWISRDMMILSTAVINGADLILTSDKTTFKPLADMAKFPCVITEESSFVKDLFGTVAWEFA